MKLAIGLCNNQKYLPSDFFYVFQSLIKPGLDIIIRGKGTIKSIQLNQITREALKRGATHIFFLDVDVLPPIDTIVKLIKHNLPVVCGLYHTKTPPYSPVAGWFNPANTDKPINNEGKYWKRNYAKFPQSSDNSGLVSVDWTGVGCMLVKTEVFRRLPYPPFWDEWNWRLGTRQLGHDINFCNWVRKCGYEVYVDRTIDCSHIGIIGVNEVYSESYNQSGMDKIYDKNISKQVFEPVYWDKIWITEDSRNFVRYNPTDMKIVKKHISDKSKVLDIGCGQGELIKELKKEKQCDVEGWDFSQYACDSLSRQGIKTRNVDLRNFSPNGECNQYDFILACQILEHLDNDKLVIQNIKKMLKNRGQIIVTVPVYGEYHEHKRSYNKQSLKTLLKGFSKITVKESNGNKNFPHLIGIGTKRR